MRGEGRAPEPASSPDHGGPRCRPPLPGLGVNDLPRPGTPAPRPDATGTPGSGRSPALSHISGPSRPFPGPGPALPGPAARSQARGEHAEGEDHAQPGEQRVRGARLHPSPTRSGARRAGLWAPGSDVGPPLRVPRKLSRNPASDAGGNSGPAPWPSARPPGSRS